MPNIRAEERRGSPGNEPPWPCSTRLKVGEASRWRFGTAVAARQGGDRRANAPTLLRLAVYCSAVKPFAALITPVENAIERRAPHPDAHLACLRSLKDQGRVVMGGAFADPVDEERHLAQGRLARVDCRRQLDFSSRRKMSASIDSRPGPCRRSSNAIAKNTSASSFERRPTNGSLREMCVYAATAIVHMSPSVAKGTSEPGISAAPTTSRTVSKPADSRRPAGCGARCFRIIPPCNFEGPGLGRDGFVERQ